MTKFFFFFVGIGILMARKWSVIIHPQLFAEDGAVFFSEVYSDGFNSFLKTYAEYFHSIPRIAAFIFAPLPVQFVPIAFMLFSTSMLAAMCWLLLSPELKLKNHWLIFFAIVFVPNQGEVFFSLTNTIWVGGFLLFLLLMLPEPTSQIKSALIYFFIGLLSVTGMYSVLLAPLYLFRAFIQRTKYSILSLFVVGFGACVQFFTLLHLSSNKNTGFKLDFSWDWVSALSNRTIMRVFFDKFWFLPDFNVPILSSFLFIGFIFASSFAAIKYRSLPLFFSISYFFLLLLSSVTRLQNPNFISGLNGDRYFLLPAFLMFIILGQLLSRSSSVILKSVILTFFLLSIFNGMKHFKFESYKILDWKNQSKCFGGPTACSIPTNPEGWGISYSPTWKYLMSWHRHSGEN